MSMTNPATTSRYAGKCKHCGATWKVGQRIELIEKTKKWCINPDCPDAPPPNPNPTQPSKEPKHAPQAPQQASTKPQSTQTKKPRGKPQTSKEYADLYDGIQDAHSTLLNMARAETKNYFASQGRDPAPNIWDIMTSLFYKGLIQLYAAQYDIRRSSGGMGGMDDD